MRRRLAALGRLVGLAALAAACWSWMRARGIPFGTTSSGWFVGPEFPERAGIAGTGTPRGEMDDLDAYRREGFDPDAVHPVVRAFYEETSDFELVAQVRWHRPFRLGAALAAPLTSAIQQLNLPGPFANGRFRMRSRFVDITAEDPRDGVRAWVRTTPDGEAVFVALYGSHESDGERFVNVGVPLPGWSLATVLRLEHFDGTTEVRAGGSSAPASPVGSSDPANHAGTSDPAKTSGTSDPTSTDGTGVEATSRGRGDPGLYAVLPGVGAFRLPVSQRFRVWPGDAPDAPGHPRPAGADAVDVVATHEMWLFGRQFLTVTYGATRTREGGRS